MNKPVVLRATLVAAVLALLTVSAAEAAGPFQFFSVTPCRIVDTRGPTGVTGGPALSAGAARNFPIDVDDQRLGG